MGNAEAETLLVLPTAEEDGNLRDRIAKELQLVFRIAVPGIIIRLTSFFCIVVTQMFIGHFNSVILAAYAIEQTVVLRFINGIMIGMSSATETLCGQAFGAGQHHMLGIYLQRTWIVNFVTVTICMPLFVFSKQILFGIGQEATVAEASSVLSLWFIPLSYSYMFNMSCQMYLQSQMKNQIIGWISAPALFVHVLLSFLLVEKFQLGLTGAMIPLIVSNWTVVVGELAYIFGGKCPNTWKGFDKAAFAQLWPVVKLSVSSGMMICLQVWTNAILVLLAGYMPDAYVKISAFSICLNINGLQIMLCLGFLAAASVRVSNELGSGNARATTFAIKVILSVSSIVGIVSFVLSLAFNEQIASLFTSDNDVVVAITDLSVPLSFSMLLNSIQAVLNGIAVGSGIQSTVAVVNLGSYYVVGLPIGIFLSFFTSLKITGLWVGLLSGVVMQITFLSIVLWRTDWETMVEKASTRTHQWSNPSEENERRAA